MKLSGAEIIVEALKREGVEVVFGYPGGQVLPLYDAILTGDLRHILTRHEQGAAHAAEGYARSTGKVGVVIATSGPGATNLVTGIADAWMDSVPLVALTGQVATALLGRDSFQEADITGITLPITKHSFLVKDANDIPRIIKQAFHIASTGRPGPVLVDIPRDIQQAKVAPQWPDGVDMPSYRPTYTGHPKQIAEATRALMAAARPVLYVGGGAVSSGASSEVLALAERLQVPVVTTLMGLGAFPGTHRLFLGMLGMHGTVAANYAVSHADLLVSVGARFDDRATGSTRTFAAGARIVHIDIDPAEIGKNVKPHTPIVGDVKSVLQGMLATIEARSADARSATTTGPWLETIAAWNNDHPLYYDQEGPGTCPARGGCRSTGHADCGSPGCGVLKPQFVLEQLMEVSGGNAIVTTEVGQHQMWAAQYLRFSEPRSFISSGGLGTMGFGLPAAMGAQVANPGRLVVCIAGDGSVQMNIQELGTISEYRIPVKILILNNGCLGMVRQWQEMFYGCRYSHSILPDTPDFVKLAEAYGIRGLRTGNVLEVRSVLEEAIGHDGPVVVDFRVCQEEKVFPMVPAGGNISEMIGGKRP